MPWLQGRSDKWQSEQLGSGRERLDAEYHNWEIDQLYDHRERNQKNRNKTRETRLNY